MSLIVTKALKMANMMNIHTLGVVENMSYLVCPKCDEQIPVFGQSHLEEFAKENNVDVLAKLPIRTVNAELMDKGKIEMIQLDEIIPCVEAITKEEL